LLNKYGKTVQNARYILLLLRVSP